jgi:hypothetical protein
LFDEHYDEHNLDDDDDAYVPADWQRLHRFESVLHRTLRRNMLHPRGHGGFRILQHQR